jgi:hypothetical protein
MSLTQNYKIVQFSDSAAFAVARALRLRIDAMRELEGESIGLKIAGLFQYSRDQQIAAKQALEAVQAAPLRRAFDAVQELRDAEYTASVLTPGSQGVPASMAAPKRIQFEARELDLLASLLEDLVARGHRMLNGRLTSQEREEVEGEYRVAKCALDRVKNA